MYKKLLIKNIQKSSKDYLIYMLTLILCVTLFYSFTSISSSFYHPSISAEYNISDLGNEIKIGITFITIVLIFLINYINNFMIKKRQKEFALQTILGMERRTTGILFQLETLAIGFVSLIIGIFFGSFVSELINFILIREYNGKYNWTYSIYPDTVFITIAVFGICFFVIGFWNLRTIKKIRIIEMLHASQKRENITKLKSWVLFWCILGLITSINLLLNGLKNFITIYDRRLDTLIVLVLVLNMIIPFSNIILYFINILFHFKKKQQKMGLLMIFSFIQIMTITLFILIGRKYFLPIKNNIYNSYMIMIALMIIICIVIFFSILVRWIDKLKLKSAKLHYKGNRLFIWGQITSKLNTSAKVMSIICITLVVSIVLLFFSPIVAEWTKGFHDKKDIYDIQISTVYNNVTEEKNLKAMDWSFIDHYLKNNQINKSNEIKFETYFLKREDFKNRYKYDFPVLAIKISDYNKLLAMINQTQIILNQDEFAIQFDATMTKEDMQEQVEKHSDIPIGNNRLTLSKSYQYNLGEDIYNFYTNMVYILPDKYCNDLFVARYYYYINTEDMIEYDQANELSKEFEDRSDIEYEKTLNRNEIRLKTIENNTSISYSFLGKAIMAYAGVILLVISFTVLSVQQLIDVDASKQNYNILNKLGVDPSVIMRIIQNQILIWFLLPILLAIFLAVIIIICFILINLKELHAYIGYNKIIKNAVTTIVLIISGMLCYYLGAYKTYKIGIKSKR